MAKGEKKEKAPKASPKKAAKGEKKEKKTKAKKDPNAPKRGLTAYILYSNAVRDEVKKENPEAKMGELSKIIGEKWKGLTDEEKAPFQKKAEADKERYAKEKAAYDKAPKKSSDDDEDDKEEEEEEDDE
ncbi:hypothetical protein N2152v2_001062 [Parachlorella kessleri]